MVSVNANRIQESAENYLETILMLSKKLVHVRSIDIANELGFSRASISISMKKLKESGFIDVNDRGYISLTPRGLAQASEVYERHRVLTAVLIALGVDKETARDDACRIEHVISTEAFDKIKEHLCRYTPGGCGPDCCRD